MTPTSADALRLEQLLAHGDFVRALARSLVADPNRADDVTQDTFVAAIERPPRSLGEPRSWLASVARNFARQSSRKEARIHARERAAARSEAAPSADEVAEREALRREIVEALLALPDGYRDVLLLRYYEDVPPREIARRLSIPVETVRTRVRRGLDRLRERLDALHEGNREAWMGSLVSFAGARAVGAASRWAALAWAVPTAAVFVGLAWWLAPRAARVEPPSPTVAAAPVENAALAQLDGSASAPPRTPAVAPPQVPAPPPAKASERVFRFTIATPERELSGVVLDERGAPVVGALVYVGNQIRARGDEPFKPFQPQRITDGVTTDVAGRYELKGSGRCITAWHAEAGVITVPWSDAERIVLPAKTPLRGRLVEGSGAPLAGRTLLFDRTEETTTDADGTFVFPRVDAGMSGLQVVDEPAQDVHGSAGLRSKPKGPFFGVRHGCAPGLPLVLTLWEGRVDVRLTSGGQPFVADLELAALGSERVFRFPKDLARARDGVVELAGLMPGRHLVIAKTGQVAWLDLPLGATRASIELGTADLTVRGPPNRVYVLPAGSGEFAELMAGRVASQKIGESGEIRIAPLLEGEYEIGIDREGILGTFRVDSTGTVVVLE